MIEVAKLAAPIAPFFADNLYKDLINGTVLEGFESVHLANFPISDGDLIDSDLERKMQKAQRISSMVLSLRKKESIKVRQPLQKIMIPVLGDQDREDILAVEDLIISEVNVKEIDLIDDASDILVKQIKPNFKVLGPRFGKNMRSVGQAIQNFGQEEINIIEKEGKITLELDGNFVDLTLSEVEITSQDIEGWLVSNANGITVALDVSISPKLKNEGIARELINRVQNLRKDSGLEVTDKISLSIQSQDELELAVGENLDYIMNETLTAELNFDKEVTHGTEIEFDDIKSCVLIQKI